MTKYQIVVQDFDGDNWVGEPKESKEEAETGAKEYALQSGRKTWIEEVNA